MRFLVGAATGVAEEILFQLATSAQGDWECLDWEQIGLAGLFGGLSAVGLGGLGSKIGNWFKKWLNSWRRGGKGVGLEKEILSFIDKSAARKAFHGEVGQAANRFFKGATSKSTAFRAVRLPDGGYRFEYFSPARSFGYGKRYVQEIDSVGNIIREFKETIGPEGLIETKWVHGGPPL